MITHTELTTRLGDLTVVADDHALRGIYFPGHWTRPDRAAFGTADGSNPIFDALATQLEAYLAGERTDFDLPLHTDGDPLAERVWAMLRAIPYGSTTSYGALAARLGNPSLAQAVGHAVGHNPISIVVPCHRVVGSDGSLTGFAGGLARKRFLLELEGALPPALLGIEV